MSILKVRCHKDKAAQQQAQLQSRLAGPAASSSAAPLWALHAASSTAKQARVHVAEAEVEECAMACDGNDDEGPQGALASLGCERSDGASVGGESAADIGYVGQVDSRRHFKSRTL